MVIFFCLYFFEVLFFYGKLKDVDEVFSIEILNLFEDVVDRFGNFYMNVRIEVFEKLLVVYICKGKIKIVFEFL